jgi:putative addiction module killer protein
MIMVIRRTDTFVDWFKGLKDREGRARIIKRLLRIEITGNLGDHASIGEGVFELRMHFGRAIAFITSSTAQKSSCFSAVEPKTPSLQILRKQRRWPGTSRAFSDQVESG